MAFKELYDCEILISETEGRPALLDCSLKEYSGKGLKETVGRSVRGQRWKCWALWAKPKIRRFSHSLRSVLPQRVLYHRHMIIISSTTTHQHVKYSKLKNCKFPNCVWCIIQSINRLFSFSYLLDKTIMKNEYPEFLSVPDKTIMNKMYIKNKAEFFLLP